MKNKTVFKGLVLAWLLVVGFSAQAQIFGGGNPFPKPVGNDPKNGCVIPKLDGERVPFPLRNANTKFELAENETYLLNGTIVQQDGNSFFKVDFDSQPWLATQKRTQFPFFRVDTKDSGMMKKFSGSLVQMAVIVRKSDVATNGQEWDAALMLDIIATPVVIK